LCDDESRSSEVGIEGAGGGDEWVFIGKKEGIRNHMNDWSTDSDPRSLWYLEWLLVQYTAIRRHNKEVRITDITDGL